MTEPATQPLTGTVQTGQERAEERQQDNRDYADAEQARAENSNRAPGLGIGGY